MSGQNLTRNSPSDQFGRQTQNLGPLDAHSDTTYYYQNLRHNNQPATTPTNRTQQQQQQLPSSPINHQHHHHHNIDTSSQMSGARTNYQQQFSSNSPECVTTRVSIHRQESNECVGGGEGELLNINDFRPSPRVISWNSRDCLSTTPTQLSNTNNNRENCLQIQPATEVYYGNNSSSRDGRHSGASISGDHGAHTMTVDGDSLTLVILDCSPQPPHIHQHQLQQERCDSGSIGATTRACDCLSGCYCQTELIVKQHLVPYDHQHQYNTTTNTYTTQQQPHQLSIEDTTTTTVREEEIERRRNQQQQHTQHEHYQQWMRERDQQNQFPPTHNKNQHVSNQQSTSYSTQQQINPNYQQQPQQPRQQQDYQHLRVNQPQNNSYQSNTREQPQQDEDIDQLSYTQHLITSQRYQPQYNFQPPINSPQFGQQRQTTHQFDHRIQTTGEPYNTNLPSKDQLEEFYETPEEMARKKKVLVRRSPKQNQPEARTQQEEASTAQSKQQSPETSQQQPSSQSPKDQQAQPSISQYRGKTRLVKKWDWNQNQFVMIEVPDGPSPNRPVTQSTVSPASTSSALQPPSSTLSSPSTLITQQQQQQQQQASTTPTTSISVTPSAQPTPNQQEVQTTAAYSALTTARPTSGDSMGSTSATSGVQYEPSWLAYRQPDLDNVHSDPLYSDLMQELQRLEEGVKMPVTEPVIVEPETFQKPVFGQSITPEHIEVNEYETIEFICRLIPISDPTMKVEWSLNGKPLKESNRILNEHEFGVVRLRIKRCEAEDSGIYQCKATNSLGEAISTGSLRVHAKGNVQCETLNPAGLDKIRLLENPRPVEDYKEEKPVEQAPKFLTHITDYLEKEEGESVHFECCLSPVDDPELKTEWFFNGRPLITGSRFHTIDDFGFIVLDIDWLFPRDTGEYVCRATNKHGSDLTRTVLRVKPAKNIILDSQLDNGPQVIDKLRQLEFPDVEQEVVVEEPDRPAHFVQQLKSEANKNSFVEGDNVHFEARVGPATDGNLTVEWFHNDKPLISGHRFKPSFDFGHIQLDILYVYAEDSGIYKCIARNATGMDVSQYEIKVKGKPSLVYQCQLPKEMEGGVQKIEEMEAMWNRAPDPEEEEAPVERRAPEFVLKPKPYTAFEGSCARFCCRITGNPRPRLTWTLNGQTVVSGSRYKLTYDGMHHLTIPKCQLADGGKVEVYARNLLGECFCTTELRVKRKVDDYRGVLKNSPNPWYDEQSLKIYQRQRSQDLTDDEEFCQFQQQHKLQLMMAQQAAEQQSHSPVANQVIGYMEPDTPDVNLLASHSHSPLVAPGDYHPVVMSHQQVIMAPAPSTIKRALDVKDDIKTPEKSFQLPDHALSQWQQGQYQYEPSQQEDEEAQAAAIAAGGYSSANQDLILRHKQQQQQQRDARHVFGMDLPRYSAQSFEVGKTEQHKGQQHQSQLQKEQQQQNQQDQHLEYQERLRQHQLEQSQSQQSQQKLSQQQKSLNQRQQLLQQQQQQQVFDPRLPPPSPESAVHGKEVHSHTHKQLQKERRQNKEIVREIIEKEIFEQEHKGFSKDNMVRSDSVERGRSQTPDSVVNQRNEALKLQQQQKQLQEQQQQQQRQSRKVGFNQQQQQKLVEETEEKLVLVEDYMIPPEFILKIQPVRAIDGDEARFECTFKGDPKPNISWYRESKMIKPSNLYNIITDLDECKSTLVIKRVSLNGNAVYTVKAENAAGSAKSSANLVIEPHPIPTTSMGGLARKIDSLNLNQTGDIALGGEASSWASEEQLTASIANDSSQSDSLASSQRVKSVRTRKLSAEQMATLIRQSPDGLIAPTFLHTIHDVQSKLGELARIDARIIGTQPMEVRWTKDGERVRADRSHKMVLEGDLYTLLILECTARDEGAYECIANNRVGEARCEAKLCIVDNRPSSSMSGAKTPELITSHSYSSSSGGGSSGVIAGSGAGAAAAGKGGMLTTSSSSMMSSSSSSSAYAQQQQQQQQQSGQRSHYGVQKHQQGSMGGGQFTSVAGMTQTATNTQQPQQHTQVPKLIKRLENQQVMEGKSVTLRCQISAFPAAEVYWYKQGDKLIKPSKFFRIFKDNDETYCLKILETFAEDQGEYKCVARAANGRAQVETKATITVIPSSPR